MIPYLGAAALLLILLWWLRDRPIFSFWSGGHAKLLWVIAGQSLVVAMQVGWLVRRWLISLPQKYPDLIAGSVGFAGQNKSGELYALLIAVVAFVVLFLLLAALYSSVLARTDANVGIDRIMLYSLIPAAVMLGQTVRLEGTPSLLLISTILLLLCIAVIGALAMLLRRRWIEPEAAFRVGAKLLLAALFLIASELGAGLLFTRLGVSIYRYGFLSLVVVATLLLAFRRRTGQDAFERNLDLAVTISQVGTALLFCVLLSPPAQLKDGTLTFFPYRPALFILVGGLVIVALLDIYWRRNRGPEESSSLESIVSPWALIAILIYIQSLPVNWPAISADDFHAAEFYLPWWLLKQFHYLPFAGYEPARGLANYVPGFLSWLFYDNTFSGQSMIVNLHMALYVFLAFFALRPVVGNLVAFLSVFSLCVFVGEPAGGLVVAIAFLAILLNQPSDRYFVRSALLWLGLAVFATAFMVAEGGIYAISTLPLGAWLFMQAFRRSRKRLLIALAAVAAGSGLAVLLAGAAPAILSAARYVVEQSGVNDVANGILWQFPPEAPSQVTSGYLWQIVRFSWLLILIPLSFRLLSKDAAPLPARYSYAMAALFIMAIVIIPRAAGRIDPVSYSRPTQTSLAFLICGLPLALLPALKDDLRRSLTVLALALIFGLIGNQEPTVATALSMNGHVAAEPALLASGKEYGLYNIGSQVVMTPAQLRRQSEIAQVLEKLLKTRETYYDATNHSSDYGFQGRPSPVVDVAFYNAPTEEQQRNAIAALQAKNVPLALVQAQNIATDGGTLSLRCFWIYRFLMDHYTPFKDANARVWMIKNEAAGRLAGTRFEPGTQEDAVDMLSSAFFQAQLGGLPGSWGSSLGGLSDRLANPVDLLADGKIVGSHSLEQSEQTVWTVAGPDPYFILTVPGDSRGDELLIETDRRFPGQYWQLFWRNELVPSFSERNSFVFDANSTVFLVPVSTAPSWYLAHGDRQLRVDLPEQSQGSIEIKRMVLYDRLP